MKTIAFDFNTREIVIQNGTTQITDNASVQNGMIIRDARCINVLSPILGIGFNPINAQFNSVVFEMNRWKKQVKQDGALTANFGITQIGIVNTIADINMEIAY